MSETKGGRVEVPGYAGTRGVQAGQPPTWHSGRAVVRMRPYAGWPGKNNKFFADSSSPLGARYGGHMG